MIIRELVASLGISFDKRGADAAKSSVDSIRKSMGLLQDSQGRWRQANGRFATDAQLAQAGIEKIGGAAAGANGHLGQLLGGLGLLGAWAGFGKMVDEAANADDYMNVLRETFKGSADDVVAWSLTTAEAMSRSEFEMRKMAGSFGSFLAPMLGGNREMAAEMSKRLTELSVDLSSFYADMSDEEAMQKLFSGIAGETESVRRLGIDLTEAGLAEFARAQGITKTVKTMSVAEKTQLRYRKILADTTDKQGDAIRTADTYENRLKALKASFQTLSVAVGGQFVHAIEGMLGGLRGGVQWLQAMIETSHITEGVIVGLGVATMYWARSLWSMYAPLLPIIAGLVLLALAVDDVLTLFEGGSSVVGDFIDSIAGQKGAHIQMVRDIKDAWAELAPVVSFAGGAISTTLTLMYKTAKALLDVLTAIGKTIGESGTLHKIMGRVGALGKLATGDVDGFQQATADIRRGERNSFDYTKTYANTPKQAFNPPPALPVVPGRGAFDMLKGAGIAGDNLASSGGTGNYTINLYGPQSRDSVDTVERAARRMAESTRRR